MSPLPGSGVFHPRWSEHHRPVAESAMTSTCAITRPGGGQGTVDPGGNWVPPTPTLVYSGACRVQARPTAERVDVVGEEQVTTRLYMVTLPWDAPDVLVGDQVRVDGADDPKLAGRVLAVVDVRYGSQQWQRDLVCQDNLG